MKKKPRKSFSRPLDEVPGRNIGYSIIMIVAISIILLRLVVGHLMAFRVGPPNEQTLTYPLGAVRWTSIRDTLAAPYDNCAAAAHLGWAWFVICLRRFLVRLPGKQWLLVGLVGIVSVSVTAIWPKSWSMTIGLVSMALALVFLALSLEASLLSQARWEIRSFGLWCLAMAVVSFAVGWICMNWSLNDEEALLLAIVAPLSSLAAALCTILKYGTSEAIARWLGTLDQRQIPEMVRRHHR